MATAGLADIQSYSWGHTEKDPPGATSWQSPPDSTDKLTVNKGPGVVPTQALELVSHSNMHKRPPVKQGTCLKIF